MNSLQRYTCKATLIGLCLVAASGAYAQTINGYYQNTRVFNNDPLSTLTITPAAPINANPATININDQYSGAFSGANRDDVLASSDGGLTAHTFGINDSWTFQTTLTLTDGFNSPRKEAGIRINSPTQGDTLLIVNSDAGEIVTFGGPQFMLWGNNAGGNGYTPGTTITLGFKEVSTGVLPDTLEVWVDYGAGVVSTGPVAWNNLEQGPVGYTVGVYAQGDASNNGDFVNGLFSNTTFTTIPEPGTFALVGMGLLGLLAIRRKR